MFLFFFNIIFVHNIYLYSLFFFVLEIIFLCLKPWKILSCLSVVTLSLKLWNPRHADVFASASGDCTLRVWDVREPGSTMVVAAHEFEILSCDWNKYDDCVIATASVDKSVRVWDIRTYRTPLAVLNGHGYAVRKVKFSPHNRSFLVSCSYDMTVCAWDYMVEDARIGQYGHHMEFAVGVDMSVLVEGLIASTSWDELVYVWQYGTDPRAP